MYTEKELKTNIVVFFQIFTQIFISLQVHCRKLRLQRLCQGHHAYKHSFSQEVVNKLRVLPDIGLFFLCDFASPGKLGHCFISEQIGKLHLSLLRPLPCGPLCLLSFYITFTSHCTAGSCRSCLLTNVCCPFISEFICQHRQIFSCSLKRFPLTTLCILFAFSRIEGLG